MANIENVEIPIVTTYEGHSGVAIGLRNGKLDPRLLVKLVADIGSPEAAAETLAELSEAVHAELDRVNGLRRPRLPIKVETCAYKDGHGIYCARIRGLGFYCVEHAEAMGERCDHPCPSCGTRGACDRRRGHSGGHYCTSPEAHA